MGDFISLCALAKRGRNTNLLPWWARIQGPLPADAEVVGVEIRRPIISPRKLGGRAAAVAAYELLCLVVRRAGAVGGASPSRLSGPRRMTRVGRAPACLLCWRSAGVVLRPESAARGADSSLSSL